MMSNQKVLNPQNRRNFIFLGYSLVLVLFWKNYVRLSTPEIYPVWTPLFSESCSWFVYITVVVFRLCYFSFYCLRTKLLELATTNAQKTSLKDDAKKGGETKNKRSSIANSRRRKVIILGFFFSFQLLVCTVWQSKKMFKNSSFSPAIFLYWDVERPILCILKLLVQCK